MLFSVIVPVYNREDEVRELLESLMRQTSRDFEVVITEDGSTQPCGEVVREYAARGLDVKYHYKENEGRSIARNHSMERASGDYFVFFDSDCVIPADYFEKLERMLAARPLDCFGGPDAADESFTTTQKAIN
ncbi:MAG: glycosyltransferase, partial [Muribaculaceae bacterium]|nr:glycosyltransferase [Muribaculaceae bacterium]